MGVICTIVCCFREKRNIEFGHVECFREPAEAVLAPFSRLVLPPACNWTCVVDLSFLNGPFPYLLALRNGRTVFFLGDAHLSGCPLSV